MCVIFKFRVYSFKFENILIYRIFYIVFINCSHKIIIAN